jgi:hypothetical protein
VFCRPREAKFSHDNPFGQPGRLTLRPSLADRQREGREKREKGQGNPALPVQQGSLGLAVPTTPEAAAVEAAGVSETSAMVEAATHPMAEAVTTAVRDIISTIGQIAVGEVGVAVVGTTVARVGH